MEKMPFDSEKYLKLQKENILKRMKMFGSKLYIEFGGKLFDDLHASRVLPGYKPNNKIKLLESLKKDIEVLFCINANDIESNKIRADHGITYSQDVLRVIDELRKLDITCNSLVITMFFEQPNAVKFANLLKNNNINVYFNKPIKGYPADIQTIVSENGYGANDFAKTEKPIVIVTAPGPGSGKLAVCLSQLYHEKKNGVSAGYAKFETFPVWNLPLKHPVNVAYEAATADLKDVNLIDSYHLEKYGEITINYNRDMETFPVVRKILNSIYGKDIYYSPTDMGVNMVGFCINNDEKTRSACEHEVIRRYYKAKVDFKRGQTPKSTLDKIEMLLRELNISPMDRKCVQPALEKFEKSNSPCIAIELKNGKIITGRTTELLSASASSILNALKYLAKIKDEFKLLSPEILKPIITLKQKYLNSKNAILGLQDVLIALSISATTNDMARIAFEQIYKLQNCECHSTHILNSSNEEMFRKLKINVTSDYNMPTSLLFND